MAGMQDDGFGVLALRGHEGLPIAFDQNGRTIFDGSGQIK
jgi:hypothetical protein